jgi:hypothetical protein
MIGVTQKRTIEELDLVACPPPQTMTTATPTL